MPSLRRSLSALTCLAVAGALGAGTFGGQSPADAASKGWKLPKGAKEVGPDTYEIESKDVDGGTLTAWAIVHRRDHEAKPAGAGGSAGAGKGGSKAYAYIASGLKWKTRESYVVDPSVVHWSGTPDASAIRAVVANGVGQWEDAANGTIDGSSVDVMGSEVPGSVNRSLLGNATNGVNEVCFDDIAENGVIAVTFVWGYYSGPARTREIVEWDQIYDDDGNFTWGDVVASGDTTIMDFADIAVHEIGHAFGMDHPDGIWVDESMYAYATEGETKKRDLHDGDIAGIDGLY